MRLIQKLKTIYQYYTPQHQLINTQCFNTKKLLHIYDEANSKKFALMSALFRNPKICYIWAKSSSNEN